VISIRTELERWEAFSRAAVNCCAKNMHSTGQHAVDLEDGQLARFREQLHALQRRLEDAAGPEELRNIEEAFDGELHDYQERARVSLARLRQDLAAAAAALEAFGGAVAESGLDVENEVKQQVHQLNRLAGSDNIQEMRQGIRASTAKIAASMEQMQSRNQLAIAQLKDEIRLLHQELNAVNRAKAPAEQASEETAERKQINARVDELMRQGRPCSVLLVVLRNLEGLRNCHPAGVIDSGLLAFAARFQGIVPGAVAFGRLGEEQFAAILGKEPVSTLALSREVMQQLSKPVVVDAERGAARSLVFDARAGVVEFRPGSDPAKFQGKLEQLAEALAK
jgi:GGDEF domain-containing protein